MMAESEARAVLGGDFDRFGVAVRRYVSAVEVAEHARSVWEAEGRPMRDSFANGMAGVSPYLKAFEQTEAQAARFADVGYVVPQWPRLPSTAPQVSTIAGPLRPSAGRVSVGP
jgi:hypothetical protein